jgi:hypothetical protein
VFLNMLLACRWTCNVVLSLIVLVLSLETVRITISESNELDLIEALSTDDSVTPMRSTRVRRPTSPSSTAALPIPKNLRLVFLGDSLTRYQYLSLAYFLRHGRWFDPDITINNLMNSHSFHHPLHPDDDWNEFFLQSNRMLFPMEVCDCLRSRNEEILVERRYFYDEINNNMMVYINMNGNKTPADRGYYGRLNPDDIFGPRFSNLVGLPFGMNMTAADSSHTVNSIEWEFLTWADVIRHHIGHLDLQYGPSSSSTSPHSNPRVILNAGIHPHDFDNAQTVREVYNALKDVNMPGYWKTTTFSKQYTVEFQKELANFDLHSDDALPRYNDTVDSPLTAVTSRGPGVRPADVAMCETLDGCLNLGWTARLRPDLFIDNLHFAEPVYRILNEEMLQEFGQLPSSYVKLDRTVVLAEGSTASSWPRAT